MGAVCLVITLDSRFVGLTPVNGDRFRDPVTADRLRQKASRGFCIPVLREQKVNGLTGLIHSPIQIPPLPLHPNIGLIHPPAVPDWALAWEAEKVTPWSS